MELIGTVLSDIWNYLGSDKLIIPIINLTIRDFLLSVFILSVFIFLIKFILGLSTDSSQKE